MDARASPHHTTLPSSSFTDTSPTQPTTTKTPATSKAAQQSLEALTDILFGSIAGATGKIIEYPFDTVKVRLQSQADHLPLQYKGPLDCFRQSIASDGVRGLYRGVSAPLAGAAAETASLFFSYRVAQDLLLSAGLGERPMQSRERVALNSGSKEIEEQDTKKLSLGWLAVAGAISGGVTSLILTPIELVKCRMQVPLPSSSVSTGEAHLARPVQLSPFTVIGDVYRREGLRGFWRGQLGTFLRESGGSAAWFGAFEASSSFFRARRRAAAERGGPLTASADSAAPLPVSQQMASGALAGMSYNFLFFPADTIKSKIQTGELTPSSSGASPAVAQRHPTFMGVGRALYAAHGLKGLYRGCGITVARSAPSSALIFTLMERLKSAFS